MDRLSKSLIRLARHKRRLYTTHQVAGRLRIRSMTLMRWIAKGNIRCPKRYTLDRARSALALG